MTAGGPPMVTLVIFPVIVVAVPIFSADPGVVGPGGPGGPAAPGAPDDPVVPLHASINALKSMMVIARCDRAPGDGRVPFA